MKIRTNLSHLMNMLGVLMITALALAALPAQPASAVGLDLYVATTGSNAGPNNCQTEATPCLTITYAISQAIAYDIIHIAAGTYAENLVISKSLYFIGAGMDQTILDGGGISVNERVVYFYGASTVVSFTDLRIQNGWSSSSGGGIDNNGATLNLTRVKVTNNTAPSGGGIKSDGTLTMVDSVVSNNTANQAGATGFGGGLHLDNSGSFSISNSTISGNTATGLGGGLHVQGAVTPSTVSMTNVTLSGNTAYNGGAISTSASGTVNLVNSTIADNHYSGTSFGGGIYNYGTVTFKNTLIARNDAPNCTNSGTLTSQGNNLESLDTCNFGASDFVDSDPALGALGNNGGLTQTYALIPGTPAVDAGTNSGCPPKDQRGATRPYNTTCDIGAFEYSLLTITGNAGVGGATLGYFDGTSKIATADGIGNYSFTVPYGWSGAVTPGKPNYAFSPDHWDYTNLQADPAPQNYTATPVVYTLIYTSVGTYDGHILESSENSSAGGTLNSTFTTFNLGDEAGDKQYRVILSFDTSTLPINANLTRVLLKIRKQGQVGTDPFTILGGLKVDMKKLYFGSSLALLAGDFNAAAHRSNAATFRTTPVNNWYIAVIGSTGYPYINFTGTTQFRLRFLTGDNDDMNADYMKFFSGNSTTAAARPTLVIQYTLP